MVWWNRNGGRSGGGSRRHSKEQEEADVDLDASTSKGLAGNAGEPKEETKGTTNTEKLRLLMWKNFLQQWRHKLQTAVEVLLPVLTASLVVILRTQVTPTAHGSVLYPPMPAYSLNHSLSVLKGMDLTKVSIAFSPRSPVLEQIVRTAVVNIVAKNSGFIGLLFIKNLLPRGFQHITNYLGNWDRSVELPDEVISVLGRFVNVIAYNKSAELHGIYFKSDAVRRILAAVEFEDTLTEATKLPDEINYKLRFPRQPRLSMFYTLGGYAWRTEHVFPDSPALGPRFPESFEGGNDPGYINEMFILLQQAISLELIKVKSGKKCGLHVNIQRFPHPPYTDDQLVEILQIILPLLIVTSFTYTAASTVRVIAREKELQLKESMNIMGLPIWLHWTAWFLKQFLFQIVSIFLVVIVLKSDWYHTEAGQRPYGVLSLTPWSVVFVFMTLYIVCTILFCFMVSGLFRKASTASLFCAVFWFLVYVPGLFLTMDSNASFMGKIISCFSVNSAMALGFQVILKAEAANKGLQWDSIFTPTSSDDEFLFGYVLMMLLVDSWLYVACALYVEQVTTGGMVQPWYFVFQLSYWFPHKHVPKVKVFKRTVENTNSIRESDPIGVRVGVEIQNLTKAFNKHVAVNRLSMSIFEDQITVLLGHNGAGKSTTISMLTGMISPTRGTATIAGHNILTHLNEARTSLGICPQHNVLFTDLTVREHLQFFSRLKGFKGEKLNKDVENLIVKLELEAKADTRAGALSGGQQRRLCVGVALCGAPRVVLLDEPTSGMDPSSRRALWDLLQREKKDRAMILTTHFMDEADILGDRIAIMAGGRLQCVGSPFFLKQQFGNGYKLIIVKGENCNVAACTKLLERDISNVKTLSSRGSEIVYNLPTTCGVTLRKKLEELEANQMILGVKSFGLAPTTLEDVFMKIGADSEKSVIEDETGIQLEQLNHDEPEDMESATENIPPNLNWRVRGLRLLGNHMLAVLMKRGLVTLRSWRLTLLQIVVPVIIVVLPVFSVQYTSVPSETIIPRELSLTRGYMNTKTILEYDKSMKDSSPSMLAMKAFRTYFINTGISIVETGNSSAEDFYINQAAEPTSMARMRFQNVIGATFKPDYVTAWYSNFGYHDVAVSLATMHNALLQAHAPNASIRVTNYPLPIISSNEMDRQKLHKLLAMQLSIAVSTSIAIVTSFFVVFYIKERVSRAKLMQNSSGIQPVVLWGMASVFDWLWFMVVCLAVILTLAALRVDGFSSIHDLGRGYLVFMVFGASVLPLQYLASFLFSGAASGFVLTYFFHIFFGTICSAIVQILSLSDSKKLGSTFDLVLQFLPTYSLSMCFRHLNTIGLRESLCQQACIVWTNIMGVNNNCTMQTACSRQLLGDLCCVENNPHFLWKSPGIARNLNCMLTTGVVLWTILMIIEYRVLNELAWWKQRTPPPLKISAEDDDVAIEAEQVRQVDEFNLYDYNLLCRDITKYYGDHLAVNQVSFGVKSKECFGLLGINGAGKTTTFKMLTGDIPISNGDAYVRGLSIRNNIKRVQENIGYCPQFDALFEELTGRETLRLYALLRGLRTEHAAQLTVDLARRLNFLKHIDKQVGHYSGGNKRKLSTALALMGYASVVYLDEPTTGVDPAAKRQVWRAIRHSTESGRSVLLTSHSMEECEALCTRLAVMVNGRFQCFGSAQHLKNKFSQGYILTAKLKHDDKYNDSNTNENAMSYIEQHFTGAKLVESYQGLVTYYLPPEQNAVMSRIFGVMELTKGQLVEDYIVSQTTLEQVFLQFTRFQKDSS